VTYVVTETCVDCVHRSCVKECPVDCIYEGGRMMYINPDQCIDCGACEEVCPMSAIRYDGDLAGADEKFLDLNAEFFVATGPLKGARKLGRIDHDVDYVAQLPRQAG